jgi:hypothetical protein
MWRPSVTTLLVSSRYDPSSTRTDGAAHGSSPVQAQHVIADRAAEALAHKDEARRLLAKPRAGK